MFSEVSEKRGITIGHVHKLKCRLITRVSLQFRRACVWDKHESMESLKQWKYCVFVLCVHCGMAVVCITHIAFSFFKTEYRKNKT